MTSAAAVACTVVFFLALLGLGLWLGGGDDE